MDTSLGRAAPRAGARAGGIAALWRDLAGSWRLAIARSCRHGTDVATLRDIGLPRGECLSAQAAAAGRAEKARLRALVQHCPWLR